MKYPLSFLRFHDLPVRRFSCLTALLFCLPAILCASTAWAQAEPLSAAAFARNFDVPFMRVSPAGRKLATALVVGLENQLCILDIDTLQPINLDFTLEEVQSAEWIDENNLLAVAMDAFDVGQIFLVNIQKGTLLKLSEFPGATALRLSTVSLFLPYTYSSGKIQLYLSFYEAGGQLYSVDLKANSIQLITSFNHTNDLVIPDSDPEKQLMETWVKDKYELVYYTAGTKKHEVLLQGSESSSTQIHPIAKIPKSEKIYMEVTGESRQTVNLFDLSTAKLGPPILSDDHYDVKATPVILPYSGEIIGLHYEKDKPYAYYFDDGIKAMMATIDGMLPGRFNLIESASANKDVFVIFSKGDTQPGEYFLYLPAKKTLKKLLGRAEWLSEKSLSAMKPIRYVARDGLSIEAYFTVPRQGAQTKPLIVLPHGGPHVRDKWRYDEFTQFLASMGYAVIQPNYRISTGYGEEFFEKGLNQVGYSIQDDILDAVKWAQEQGYGKDRNVCIVGASFGGYAAMRAATTNPDLFKCVIAIAGFYDVAQLLEGDKNRSFYSLMKKMYGDPDTDKARIDEASPIHSIEKLKAPVLVIHGEKDHRVSYTQAKNLIDELKNKNKIHETFLRPDEGHTFYKVSNRQKMFEIMGKFLNQYLPAKIDLSTRDLQSKAP